MEFKIADLSEVEINITKKTFMSWSVCSRCVELWGEAEYWPLTPINTGKFLFRGGVFTILARAMGFVGWGCMDLRIPQHYSSIFSEYCRDSVFIPQQTELMCLGFKLAFLYRNWESVKDKFPGFDRPTKETFDAVAQAYKESQDD